MGSTSQVETDVPFLTALNTVSGIGPMRIRALVSYFGSAKASWKAPEDELRHVGLPKDVLASFLKQRRQFDIDAHMKKLARLHVTVLVEQDGQYPGKLGEIPDPPVLLFVRGDVSVLQTTCVGVVGTRKMTAYGREVTETITTGLVGGGFTVVSGLAYGVDSVAHRVSLACGGKTIAVLGCGVDCVYPKGNEGLAREILEKGGALISEVPLSRWVTRGMFPARNRIISGLSEGVLVTEAAEDSGSLITARLAIEQGREVFAVPGPITSPLSKGPADLIKLGAKLVYSVEDILEEFGMRTTGGGRQTILSSALSREELIIAQLLTNEPKDRDILIRDSGLPVAAFSAVLTGMELKGYVACEGRTVRLVMSLEA